MKYVLHSFALTIVMASLLVATGCAARAAPDFKGSWKPVNHYAESPMAIPLHQAYSFQPSPMDGTLKRMLERWARDSNLRLSYQHPSDFTLYAPVEQINTDSIEQAAAQLTAIYAPQQVFVSIDGNQVIVSQVAPVATMPPLNDADPASD